MEPKSANNFFFTHRPTDRQTLGLIEVPSQNLKAECYYHFNLKYQKSQNKRCSTLSNVGKKGIDEYKCVGQTCLPILLQIQSEVIISH